MTYRKNSYRRDLLQRFGQEAGLPLFDGTSKPAPEHVKKQLERAPKAMEVATETRKLGEMTARADELRLGQMQQEVLDLMYTADDWTNGELARKLGWGVNRVTPRVFELRQFGLVIKSCHRVCGVTGMVVTAWRVK